MSVEKINKSGSILILLYSSSHQLNMTNIAKELKMFSGNASKLINGLERGGLLKRNKEIGDKRVYVKLTPKGKRLGMALCRLKNSHRHG